MTRLLVLSRIAVARADQQQKELRDGNRHQASRHGIRNRRLGAALRIHQAGEPGGAGEIRLCRQAQPAAGVHRAEDDDPGA